jgi:hypothetical protein
VTAPVKYRYYLPYIVLDKQGGGVTAYGALDISRDAPIASLDDLQDIAAAQEKDGTMLFTSWQRFEAPDAV